MEQPAIFLDKDGTLLDDVPYNVEPRLMRLAPRAGEALRLLSPHFRLIVVSNQSGVAHGYFAEAALTGVERRLKQLLASHNVELSGFYYCPHHPQGVVSAYRCACDCRKPLPGMLRRSAREQNIALEQSWMVGDILDDVEAGRWAGCRTILVDNGGETQWKMTADRTPEFTVSDLYVAAERILGASADTVLSQRRQSAQFDGSHRLSEKVPG
ncbi:MAG TPA: HAD family hydrolase [Pirellulales bacterium]|nr:HAD family hydrolase [Pirellulales bacterium]